MAPTQWTSLHDCLKDFMHRAGRYEDCKEIIRFLSKYNNNSNSLDVFDASSHGKNNLLFESFLAHNLPVMKLLLEAGADPCIANKNGTNLLHVMANAIISHGSLINVIISHGSPIKHFPNLQVTHHLLELYESMKDGVKKNAFVNAVDNTGITPLMAAAKVGNYNMGAWLLENGAKVNAKRPGGWTAGHEASWKGHPAMLQLLLENGANPNIEATHATNLKLRDVAGGNKDIIELLDAYSPLE